MEVESSYDIILSRTAVCLSVKLYIWRFAPLSTSPRDRSMVLLEQPSMRNDHFLTSTHFHAGKYSEVVIAEYLFD